MTVVRVLQSVDLTSKGILPNKVPDLGRKAEKRRVLVLLHPARFVSIMCSRSYSCVRKWRTYKSISDPFGVTLSIPFLYR